MVAPDRTTYSGFIDLYHICESSELKCLQIVLDHPGTETVAIQIRQYPSRESRRSRIASRRARSDPEAAPLFRLRISRAWSIASARVG